jgi:glycosyltransferase involved in cell wall biosynthesis
VHRVDYVPSHQVTALLRDADIGLVPLLHRPNHEISLVTKYLEYLHAGLPVVVSQVRAMAAFTSEHRVGEVYATGDPRALAEAVSTVMASRDRYAQAVATDPAVAATAWSRQAEVLGDLYDRLVPAPDYPGDR